MTYRDRPLTCPRCAAALVRFETRDKWHCARCHGAMLAIEELAPELAAVAPALLVNANVAAITTIGRRTRERALACAVCGIAMHPVFLAGVELGRCYTDGLVWFDLRELAAAIATTGAGEHARRSGESWLGKLLA